MSHTMLMYKPKTSKQKQQSVKHVSKKLTALTAASFTAFCVLSILVIVLSLMLITRNRQNNSLKNDTNTLALAFYKKGDELTIARRELAAKAALPDMTSFAQQCTSGTNSDQALFTLLNDTPIENYNVFLVDCRSNITAGRAEPRVVVFRVNNDGTKELTYGANASEPLCIPNKLPVASKLADRLALPVCVTN